jgi:hypothetical protein
MEKRCLTADVWTTSCDLCELFVIALCVPDEFMEKGRRQAQEKMTSGRSGITSRLQKNLFSELLRHLRHDLFTHEVSTFVLFNDNVKNKPSFS